MIPKQDSSQFDQELLNQAIEKARLETEQKYEAKLNKVIQELNSNHKSVLGKFFHLSIIHIKI